MVDVGATECQIEQRIEEMMETIFNIVSICLGSIFIKALYITSVQILIYAEISGLPDETITWEYVDKSKTYHSIGPITPQEFYTKHVKPIYDVNNKVHIKYYIYRYM